MNPAYTPANPKPQSVEEWEKKGRELITLLIECRDALPAITDVRARLYNVRLDLAARIETALEPWRIA